MQLSRTLIGRLGWTTGGYAAVQALRLVSNIVLARLLAPELFGIMVLVTTLRTGIELLSDVGIGQNIVRSRRGEEPTFYNTAWTVQVVRGFLLGAVFVSLAGPLARFYEDDALRPLLTVAALFFVVDGFQSPGRHLVQRRVDTKRFVIFETSVATISVAATIILALIRPDAWALLFGNLFGAVVGVAGTYFLLPGIRHRFILDRSAFREILSFGKWVFFSSMVYFLAVNFDRLYMGKSFAFAVLGVYGIARSLSDILGQLAARFGSMLIFPMVAASSDDMVELRRRLSSRRPLLLVAAAAALGAFLCISDVLVEFLYDERYRAAATMLPVLCIGVWFSILCTVNESVLLGIGRPAYGAMGNAAKLVTLFVGLPLVIPVAGIPGAICVIAASEMARYFPIWFGERRQHLGFARRDALVTLMLAGIVLALRSLFWSLGLTPGLDALFSLPLSLLP